MDNAKINFTGSVILDLDSLRYIPSGSSFTMALSMQEILKQWEQFLKGYRDILNYTDIFNYTDLLNYTDILNHQVLNDLEAEVRTVT